MLDQAQYIEQLLQKFNMSNCKPANTPLESNLCFDNSSGDQHNLPEA